VKNGQNIGKCQNVKEYYKKLLKKSAKQNIAQKPKEPKNSPDSAN